eukprot:scaffold3403_cov300-Pinguiococcus_pyrenoidosus.AAC.2
MTRLHSCSVTRSKALWMPDGLAPPRADEDAALEDLVRIGPARFSSPIGHEDGIPAQHRRTLLSQPSDLKLVQMLPTST